MFMKTALLQRECKLCLRLQAKPALQLSANAWAAFDLLARMARPTLNHDVAG